jgi:ABC-type branched-subunit amino acid transport system substrate-binding protein
MCHTLSQIAHLANRLARRPILGYSRAMLGRRCVLLVALATSAVLIAACGSSSSSSSSSAAGAGGSTGSGGSGNPINIGLVIDTTGSTKAIGDAFYRGAVAAAKLFGPIDGRPVHFITENGEGFSAAATSADVIRLATQDHAVAVLGMAAGECTGAISVADRVHLPMIGTSCVIQQDVGSNCSPWFLNGDPSPLGLATAMKVVLPKALPGFIGKKWVVIGDDPGWSVSVGDYWDKVPGASTAGIEIAPFGTTDWAPYIAKLKASGAQGLLLAISFGVQYPTFMQQANAAGLFKQMKFAAPLGFPEDGMVPGYGELASNNTVAALLKTFVVWQYGAPWTYLIQNPLGKQYVDTYYSLFHNAPPAQSNMQMDNTWRMLTAIKQAGPSNPVQIMEDLRKPTLTPYYTKPIGVQPDGVEVLAPAWVTQLKKLAHPMYGVTYANVIKQIIPASEVIPSAQVYGCHLASLQ